MEKKKISLIKTQSHYWISPTSKTVVGMWIATKPFIQLPLDSSQEDMVEQFKLAMEASTIGVPHPKDWDIFTKESLAIFKTKSLSSFYKNALQCSVSKEGEAFTFLPYKNAGKGAFLPLLEGEFKLPTAVSDEEIYEACMKCLSLCV